MRLGDERRNGGGDRSGRSLNGEDHVSLGAGVLRAERCENEATASEERYDGDCEECSTAG